MDGVWTITKDHLKLLEAAELFIKRHEYVPMDMLRRKVKIPANYSEFFRDLVNLKFIQTFSNTCKLSLSGFDCLAINSLRQIGLNKMGSPIGIGKESDIYIAEFNGQDVAIKVHRLGRSSFNRIEERELKAEDNWFFANRESARKEAEYLELFSELPVPAYYAINRHMIVMEFLSEYEMLYKITVPNPAEISQKMFLFLRDMWDLGYAHGDFNEFNVMVKEDEIKVIDFPQSVPVSDPKAHFYLKRDIECVHKYFWKKNRFVCDDSILRGICDEHGIEIEVPRGGNS